MVTVQVPAQVFLGQTDVYVVHPRHGRSNAARLAASGDLGFVALGDSVGVLDKHSTNNELVKKIRVDGSAMDVVTTSDNARAYVAVLDQSSSSGSSSLAVVDTLTLDIATNIALPAGFSCWRLAVDPLNEFVYAAGNGDTVLVIDIQPDSDRFHEVVHTIQLPHSRWTNDGLAVSPDGRRLYVSTYTKLRLEGSIVVIDVDPADRTARPELYRAVIADKPVQASGGAWHPQKLSRQATRAPSS